MCTNLFNVEGKPLKFYLETFKCFGILIKDHGGIIVEEPDNDTYTLTDPNLQIKQEQQVERYHIEFAVESIHLGRLLDIRKFRISDIDSKNQDGKMNNTIVKSEPNIQQSTLVSDNNEKLKNNVVSIQQTSPETSTTKRKLRSNLKEIEKKLPRLIKQRKKRTNKNNKDLLNLNKQTNQVTNKIIEQIDNIIKNETDNNSSENSSTDKPINHENKLPNNLSSKLPKELPNEILNDEKNVLISETINGDKKIIYVDDDDEDI
ncbi:probable cyclin-dependent serine/threonine-protein kinase DDB_G0292550 [Aphidius gifuensis]|uniref:probable cyclin-dependent serine/threonine-protein kinase DDB_G0292550 n=1 Tax=Aphidius gifuensis TaxID=684658 RepID=UPI001CDCCC05|nr:probable cyclin-dependent serine/threonine-protein kinase DDB_G0292550 [Aphidius gifuensis]